MTTRAPPSQGIRTAIDLGPLAVFFAANWLHGIMTATAALMVATVVAIAASYSLERRLPPMPAVTCAFVLVFGGLTLLFDDELFIKIKPTLVNSLFALALLVGLLLRLNLPRILLGHVLKLSDRGWYLVTWIWISVFVVLAILNEIVWRLFDTDTWVSYKVFSAPVVAVVFAVALFLVARNHSTAEDTGA